MPEPKPLPIAEQLIRQDSQLRSSLRNLHIRRLIEYPPLSIKNILFRNFELAQAVETETEGGKKLTSEGLMRIEDLLREKGALNITINREHKLNPTDAEGLPVVAATDNPAAAWPMPDHVWIRDQAQVIRSLMRIYQLDPKRYAEEGKMAKELLTSALELMSTPAQLARFDNIIAHTGDKEYVSHPHRWPHVFLALDNLNGEKQEKWAHKQDAWQMLAIHVFEALDSGFMTMEELKTHPNWTRFLGLCAPFLAAVDFTNQESSGSWEEITARRRSVIGVETALIYQIQKHFHTPGYSFLREEFVEKIPELNQGAYKQLYSVPMLQEMAKEGVKLLPGLDFACQIESINYSDNDPKWREYDAALLNILDYDLPWPQEKAQGETIATNGTNLFSVLKRYDIEGIRRYVGDSYQGLNYYTPSVQGKLRAMYAQTEINDLEGVNFFVGRGEIVPKGASAVWTHFVAQTGVQDARMLMERIKRNERVDESKLTFLKRMLLRSLSFVTGEGEFSVAPDEQGLYQPCPAKSWQMPECIISWDLTREQDLDSYHAHTPSPNQPLFWSVAKLRELLATSIELAKHLETP